MKISIRIKLILAILLPLLAVYCGVLVGNYYSARREVLHQAERYLIQLSNNDAANLDAEFRMAERAAESLASLVSEQTAATINRRADVMLRGVLLSRAGVQAVTIALGPAEGPGGQADEPFGRYTARRISRTGQPKPPARHGRGPRRRPSPPASAPSPTSAPSPDESIDLSDPSNDSTEPPPVGPANLYAQGIRRGDLAKVSPDFRSQKCYFDANQYRRTIWTEPLLDDKIAIAPVCRCVRPIVRDGKFLGVVAVDLSIRSLRGALTETKLESGYCILVSRDGLLVSHPRKDIAMRQTLAGLAQRENKPELYDLSARMIAGESRVMEFDDFHTKLPSWVVFAPIRSSGWSFGVVIPKRLILAPIDDWLRRDLAVMVGGLGVIVFVVTMVSVRITRPIGRLVTAVRALGGGDLRLRVGGTHRRDELGELSRAFNGMVRALAHHVEARMREAASRKAVESELKVAREIQASLLPTHFPQRQEFELHAMIVPAKEVAGDFFDFFYVRENELALLIADVSGKGVPAALFMAVTRTVIRNQAMSGLPPAEVLNRANRLLVQGNERMMFVTMFFAHYNLTTGKLVYANAGHNPPVMSNGAGGVRKFGSSTGPILGVFEDEQYTQKETVLESGDSLVLYTDGVTEAMDADDQQYRLEHLARIVADNPTASPEEICGLVVQSVESYRSHPQQDDVTLLVLRRNR